MFTAVANLAMDQQHLSWQNCMSSNEGRKADTASFETEDCIAGHPKLIRAASVPLPVCFCPFVSSNADIGTEERVSGG